MSVVFFDFPCRQARLGQWIRTWNGFVWHHGIVSGCCVNPASNMWSVVVTHTIQHHGVVSTSLEEFCQGRHIEIVEQPYRRNTSGRSSRPLRPTSGSPIISSTPTANTSRRSAMDTNRSLDSSKATCSRWG